MHTVLRAMIGLIATIVTADAAEMRVLSAGGVRAALSSALPLYESKSGNKVHVEFATPGVLKEKVLKEEPAELALVTSNIVDLNGRGRYVQEQCASSPSAPQEWPSARVQLWST